MESKHIFRNMLQVSFIHFGLTVWHKHLHLVVTNSWKFHKKHGYSESTNSLLKSSYNMCSLGPLHMKNDHCERPGGDTFGLNWCFIVHSCNSLATWGSLSQITESVCQESPSRNVNASLASTSQAWEWEIRIIDGRKTIQKKACLRFQQ